MRVEKIKLLQDNLAVLRCSTTNTSTTVSNILTVASVTTEKDSFKLVRASGSFANGMVAGDRISGTGIPSGARIVRVAGDTAFMNLRATASGSITLSFWQKGFIETGFLAGLVVTGTNIPADTTIASVDSENQITLSAAATGTGQATVTQRNDILANKVIKTKGVACLGARQVVFMAKTASDTDAPAVGTFEWSVDGTNYQAANTIFFRRDDTIQGSALNVGQATVISPAAANMPFLPASNLRYTITGHALNTITGVTLEAWVLWD